MARAQRLQIELSEDLSELVRRKVSSGEFADENDVIAEGLHMLRDKDVQLERWLRTEVAEAYDRLRADPSSARTPEQVMATLQELHEKTTAGR